MSDFRVDIQGLPQFRAKLRRAPEVLRTEMQRSVLRLVIRGEAISKQRVRKDTRHLMRSIGHRVTPFAGGVRGEWGTAVDYGRVVEDGRGAGKPMPPKGVLLGWMRRHGIPESAEFALRRKIGRDGITPKPFISLAFRALRPIIPKEFNAAVSRALKKAGFR